MNEKRSQQLLELHNTNPCLYILKMECMYSIFNAGSALSNTVIIHAQNIVLLCAVS